MCLQYFIICTVGCLENHQSCSSALGRRWHIDTLITFLSLSSSRICWQRGKFSRISTFGKKSCHRLAMMCWRLRVGWSAPCAELAFPSSGKDDQMLPFCYSQGPKFFRFARMYVNLTQ